MNLKLSVSYSNAAKIYLIIFSVILNSLLVEPRRVAPKNFEAFCMMFPTHRLCMGAFAGGGKRSIPEENASFNQNNNLKSDNYLNKLEKEEIHSLNIKDNGKNLERLDQDQLRKIYLIKLKKLLINDLLETDLKD